MTTKEVHHMNWILNLLISWRTIHGIFWIALIEILKANVSLRNVINTSDWMTLKYHRTKNSIVYWPEGILLPAFQKYLSEQNPSNHTEFEAIIIRDLFQFWYHWSETKQFNVSTWYFMLWLQEIKWSLCIRVFPDGFSLSCNLYQAATYTSLSLGHCFLPLFFDFIWWLGQ